MTENTQAHEDNQDERLTKLEGYVAQLRLDVNIIKMQLDILTEGTK